MTSVTDVEIRDEHVPPAADWAEFTAWAASCEAPEPSAEDRAWWAGFTAGRSGGIRFPVGLYGPLRGMWERGYEEGYRAAAAGGIGPYLRREHERRPGLIPAALAARIACVSVVGHGSGPDADRPAWAD